MVLESHQPLSQLGIEELIPEVEEVKGTKVVPEEFSRIS